MIWLSVAARKVRKAKAGVSDEEGKISSHFRSGPGSLAPPNLCMYLMSMGNRYHIILVWCSLELYVPD